jgi:hypothetical protein
MSDVTNILIIFFWIKLVLKLPKFLTDMTAKVGDFGIAQLMAPVPPEQQSIVFKD